MKKIISVIIMMSLLIGLAYLYKSTDMLDFVKCQEISEEERVEFSKRWYYSNLTEHQKEIYVHFAKGTKEIQEVIRIKQNASMSQSQIKENVNKAIIAYVYDYPETFYVQASYELKIIDVLNYKIIEIYPKYMNKDNISSMKEEMQVSIQNITKLFEESMSDYEKELIVHDYLTKNVVYYDWTNIENIPDDMHTAYGALVKKQAVCDGISKAFQIVMQEEEIECITAVGELDNVPHAWNMIELYGDYYHIDLTSDQFKIGKEETSKLSHLFFNLTDSEIKQTHSISTDYNYPVCTAAEYNYYYKQNKIVKENQNLRNKVNNIVNNSKNEELLEIRVLNRNDVSSELAQILYDIDFNRYKSNGVESIGYTKNRDIYVYQIKK